MSKPTQIIVVVCCWKNAPSPLPLLGRHLPCPNERMSSLSSMKQRWTQFPSRKTVAARFARLPLFIAADDTGAPPSGLGSSSGGGGGPMIVELPLDKIRRPLMRTRSNDATKVQQLMDI